MMWPDERRDNEMCSPLWDTPDYWAKKKAREGLMLAKQRAKKDRPRRSRRVKLAQQSKRRNRA